MRERYDDCDGEREREGLLETYRPFTEGERSFLMLGLLDLERLRLGLRLPRLVSSSFLPSIAPSSRLLRGPISPFSSSVCRLAIRGRMMSQTLSSVSKLQINSSK